MKLNEYAQEDYDPKQGDIICPDCNGSGVDKDKHYLCPTCIGNGFRDWVRSIVGVKYVPSSLHNLRIRSLVMKIQHDITKILDDSFTKALEIQEELLNFYLETLHGTSLWEYKVDCYQKPNTPDTRIYNVNIRPVKTVERIILNFTLVEGENDEFSTN